MGAKAPTLAGADRVCMTACLPAHRSENLHDSATIDVEKPVAASSL
jgi:hypothetical protein